MKIRRIRYSDNLEIKKIIRDVMTEYGANGEGFSIHDKEVDDMYTAYNNKGSVYYVIEEKGHVYGGAGIGPIPQEDDHICELKKMYFLKIARGKGIGKKLLNICLVEAQKMGYTQCYIETLSTMKEAQGLYENSGFVQINAPRGNTGHFGCDRWLIKNLSS